MPKACRNCKIIIEEKLCPICKSTELSDDFSGLLVVINPEGSVMAHKRDIKKEGRYALRIR